MLSAKVCGQITIEYMSTAILEVQSRDPEARAKDLLAKNILPLEYYGKGVKNRSLQVDYQAFRRLYNQVGESTVVELKIDGKEAVNVLVHEVKHDPVSDKMTHVDLINIRMDVVIHTHIPLKFVGVSNAVKDNSGTLMTPISQIEIKCLPKDLVHEIEVSIDPLVDFHTNLKIKDIVVPAGITVLNKPEEVVAMVVPPRVEEEAAPVASAEGEAAAPVEGAAPAAAEGETKPEKE